MLLNEINFKDYVKVYLLLLSEKFEPVLQLQLNYPCFTRGLIKLLWKIEEEKLSTQNVAHFTRAVYHGDLVWDAHVKIGYGWQCGDVRV